MGGQCFSLGGPTVQDHSVNGRVDLTDCARFMLGRIDFMLDTLNIFTFLGILVSQQGGLLPL